MRPQYQQMGKGIEGHGPKPSIQKSPQSSPKSTGVTRDAQKQMKEKWNSRAVEIVDDEIPTSTRQMRKEDSIRRKAEFAQYCERQEKGRRSRPIDEETRRLIAEAVGTPYQSRSTAVKPKIPATSTTPRAQPKPTTKHVSPPTKEPIQALSKSNYFSGFQPSENDGKAAEFRRKNREAREAQLMKQALAPEAEERQPVRIPYQQSRSQVPAKNRYRPPPAAAVRYEAEAAPPQPMPLASCIAKTRLGVNLARKNVVWHASTYRDTPATARSGFRCSESEETSIEVDVEMEIAPSALTATSRMRPYAKVQRSMVETPMNSAAGTGGTTRTSPPIPTRAEPPRHRERTRSLLEQYLSDSDDDRENLAAVELPKPQRPTKRRTRSPSLEIVFDKQAEDRETQRKRALMSQALKAVSRPTVVTIS